MQIFRPLGDAGSGGAWWETGVWIFASTPQEGDSQEVWGPLSGGEALQLGRRASEEMDRISKAIQARLVRTTRGLCVQTIKFHGRLKRKKGMR